jgi:uncharacterized protein
MAGASLLALIDDIATVLDDVALMTKLAAKKTAGVLGDDLALNAQQVAGVRAERELPVVWAVAKGSTRNKLILVPLALALSALAPWAVTPVLMIGGAYLCYEGFEKLAHRFLHSAGEDGAARAALEHALLDPDTDMVAFEQDRIRGAIRTDFVLSAEIIVIALGTVQAASFAYQAAVVTAVAAAMTVGVYGFVAGIVKLDDAGMLLLRDASRSAGGWLKRALGNGLLWIAPRMMKVLSVLGTAAMFLVGGGILLHGVAPLSGWLHGVQHAAAGVPGVGAVLADLTPALLNGGTGIVAGAIVLGAVSACGALAAYLRGR